MACDADYVFVPEWPPENDWPDKLCSKLQQVSILDMSKLKVIVNSL